MNVEQNARENPVIQLCHCMYFKSKFFSFILYEHSGIHEYTKSELQRSEMTTAIETLPLSRRDFYHPHKHWRHHC